MKTQFKSLNTVVFRLGKFFLLGLLAVACSGTGRRAGEGEEKRDYTEVPEELSLKEDREYLDKLREEVPEERREENDELAFTLKMMGEVKERPNKIRDRWNTETRRRREQLRKLNAKDRTEYNKREKSEREKFLKELGRERNAFVKKKVTSEERREFFSEQEMKRREYFGQQSDRRKDFESQMRQRSLDFEANMRDRNSEFNAEHRAYGERYRQWEKEKKDLDKAKEKHNRERREEQRREQAQAASGGGVTSSNAGASKASGLSAEDEKLLKEFDQIPKTGKTPLKAGDE